MASRNVTDISAPAAPGTSSTSSSVEAERPTALGNAQANAVAATSTPPVTSTERDRPTTLEVTDPITTPARSERPVIPATRSSNPTSSRSSSTSVAVAVPAVLDTSSLARTLLLPSPIITSVPVIGGYTVLQQPSTAIFVSSSFIISRRPAIASSSVSSDVSEPTIAPPPPEQGFSNDRGKASMYIAGLVLAALFGILVLLVAIVKLPKLVGWLRSLCQKDDDEDDTLTFYTPHADTHKGWDAASSMTDEKSAYSPTPSASPYHWSSASPRLAYLPPSSHFLSSTQSDGPRLTVPPFKLSVSPGGDASSFVAVTPPMRGRIDAFPQTPREEGADVFR